MPHAKNNTKMTGDTHLPDVESDLPLEEGASNAPGTTETARDRGKAGERGKEGRPGRSIRKAGLLKDKDDETSDSDRNTRDSGEGTDETPG